MLGLTRSASARPDTALEISPLDRTPARATEADYLSDGLTGLGSLLALRNHLALVIDHYQPFGLRPALILIDVDRFATINTAYGRTGGDGVLVATADRLRRLVPGDGATYRTGGDEFVALLDTTPMFDAVAAAGAIQQTLGEPVDIGWSTVPLSVSVAVVMLGYRDRVDALLRDADVTMYRAKTEGGNRVDVYNWELDSWATARKRDVERLQSEVEELREQNKLLADALTCDLATGMPNGLAFEADLLECEAGRQRAAQPYSILRVRVDGMDDVPRSVRTRAAAGALTSVAHAVRDSVRRPDRVYVLDAGDLAVLVRGPAAADTLATAECIRGEVERRAVADPAHPSTRLSVTVAAVEAGFRHPDAPSVLDDANRLLDAALGQPGTVRSL
jgi:diguanylate cyclase (GGDEF)-like protein